MADSDEEYERRRGRDKFRRERSDYQERRGDERNRREETSWPDRRGENWGRDRNRRDYREYDNRRRDVRYSPTHHDLSPPGKRMRRDWDDARGYSGYDAPSYNTQNWSQSTESHTPSYSIGQRGESEAPATNVGVGPTQPPMMTFKQFLATQDDTISDSEAVTKYNEYKVEFKKQQLNEFFSIHKEEEWFKWKYHPEEYARRKQEQHAALLKRLGVFMELIKSEYATNLSIDTDKSTEILKFLDAVVIKLEGGDDNDLKILDEPSYLEVRPEPLAHHTKSRDDEEDPKLSEDWDEGKKSEPDSKGDGLDTSSETNETVKKSKESKEEEATEEVKEAPENKRKRKREYNSENEDSGTETDSENEHPPPPVAVDEDSLATTGDENKQEVLNGEEKEEEGEAEASAEHSVKEGEENADDAGSTKDEEVMEEDTRSNKPRALHQTCSIFLRYLAPSITRAEVEAICKRYPGFLRVAIADPQPERRFFRRGWITFERDVNIKDICWNLNNMRLRDCELGAIVNRDLSRRIRPGSHLAAHKQVVRSDIKLAAKIIQNLDARQSLWTNGEEKETKQPSFGLASKNPILHNITDYLIEEASAEEEELLGRVDDDKNKEDQSGEIVIDRDEALIKVLDRLLMYLRIVHSVDYYNSSEYPNEDEMPNRCGIMHARTIPPMNRTNAQEIEEYISGFEGKMQTFLAEIILVTDEECAKLGKKESDAELEKFVLANTQELAPDKWLCPLSGKKFKGPEFVRKHIFNKHGDRVEEVKKEVEYFNNYLRDPKRPMLPAYQPPRPQQAGGDSGPRTNNYGHVTGGYGGGHYGGYGNRGSQGGYSGGYGSQNYGRGYNANYRGGNQFYYERRAGGAGGRRGGRDPRELINYRDLDAPETNDAF